MGSGAAARVEKALGGGAPPFPLSWTYQHFVLRLVPEFCFALATGPQNFLDTHAGKVVRAEALDFRQVGRRHLRSHPDGAHADGRARGAM